MVDYARFFPRHVLDAELRNLLIDTTSQLYAGVRVVTAREAPVTSVNGMTGAVELSKAHVGLDKVANLSPAEMPLSEAFITALATKVDAASTFPISTISGLTEELAARVRSVNGVEPDPASGDVQVVLPDLSTVATWPVDPEPGDVITYGAGWEAGKPYPHDGPLYARVIGDPAMPVGWRWLPTERTPDAFTVPDDPGGRWVGDDPFVWESYQPRDPETGEPDGAARMLNRTPGAQVLRQGTTAFTAAEVNTGVVLTTLPWTPPTSLDLTQAFAAFTLDALDQTSVTGRITLSTAGALTLTPEQQLPDGEWQLSRPLTLAPTAEVIW